MRYIIIAGSISKGFVVYGLFKDRNEAQMWGEETDIGDYWEIRPLRAAK